MIVVTMSVMDSGPEFADWPTRRRAGETFVDAVWRESHPILEKTVDLEQLPVQQAAEADPAVPYPIEKSVAEGLSD